MYKPGPLIIRRDLETDDNSDLVICDSYLESYEDASILNISKVDSDLPIEMRIEAANEIIKVYNESLIKNDK